MDEKLIQKGIKKMLAETSGAVLVEDLKSVVDTIFSVMKEMKVYIESEMTKGDSQTMKMCESMMSDMKDMESKMSEMMKSKMSMTDMNKALQGVLSEVSSIKANMPTMPDLSVLEARIDEIKASIPVIKEQMKETPEETRDLLESIKVESEKLNIDAIGYLREELDKLKKIRSTGKSYALFGGGGSSGGGRTVQVYDLSDQLNGVLTSFNLPAFWKIIQVTSSSFPFVFRPTVDFTVSGTIISFTSEVVASTMLNTGQSILIIYAE
jgi:hypothetical protein